MGDAITSGIALAGKLLKKAEDLLRMGVKTSNLVTGATSGHEMPPVSITLMIAMYEANKAPDSTPRYRWFAIITFGATVYYFVPGFLDVSVPDQGRFSGFWDAK